MEMTTQHIDTGLRVLQIIVIPLLALGIREFRALRRTQRKQNECLQRLESKVARHDEKFADLPDQGAMHELAIGMAEIQGDLKAMNEKIGGLKVVVEKVDRVLDRQEEYLLSCGGRK